MAKPKWSSEGVLLDSETWTANDVLGIVLDPRSVGVGGSPAIIQDEQWITANAKLISDMGTEAYLTALLAKLREAFE